MSEIVFLNDQFLPLDQAAIPITDRGFLFGDGIYEVIPCYHGQLFRFNQHIARLQRSLEATQIELPLNHSDWHEILTDLIARNGNSHHSIYIQITRGTHPVRYHTFPKECKPTILVRCTPLTLPTIESLSKGAAVITRPDIRWEWCYIKSLNLLPNVLMREEAEKNNASEVIFIKNGYAIECASSNLFAVKNETIITPPKTKNILGGITRDLILELATKNNVRIKETPIKAKELPRMNEIWFTGSSKTIVPVTTLDGQPVDNGKAGPVWQRMIALFFKEITA